MTSASQQNSLYVQDFYVVIMITHAGYRFHLDMMKIKKKKL
jgi:hypothetical protein